MSMAIWRRTSPPTGHLPEPALPAGPAAAGPAGGRCWSISISGSARSPISRTPGCSTWRSAASTRRPASQQVWQVRVVPPPPGRPPSAASTCRPVSAVRRAADQPRRSRRRRRTIPASCRRSSGYRGLENRLYRVEVHTAGPLGTARFKWSRDNGSIVSAVNDHRGHRRPDPRSMSIGIGRDRCLRFHIGDWVTVTDDHARAQWASRRDGQIVDIDETNASLVLDRALPA